MRHQDLDTAVDDSVAAGVPLVIAGVTDADATSYLHAAGAAPDTVIALYSATKAFTATAALQCVEDGLIDLDAPAREYVPEIAALQVLEDLGDDGTVRSRPPTRDITPRMLLLHTSGLAYDMFDKRYALLARERMRHPSSTPLWDSINTPLLHDPGERWTYGTSMDWMGLVIAAVRGKRLDDVFAERIYAPCGMTSTSFDISPDMRARLSRVYRHQRDGSIVPTKVSPPDTPELDMGGQGLFSTVSDLLALLRVWLGDGSAPGGQVLRPDTLAWAVQGAPGVEPTPLPSAIPALTREADFFPGQRKSWAYSFLRNEDDVADGRRAGSLTWAGLPNVFYWIDRASGVAAVWASQLLPFFDPLCEEGVEAFEKAVYAE
ncbi:class A beta-lactamase-related serine hydrolase [Microbacterium protaetiae]|uniref:Class A beta-lactamase-related serine hydrolase n=1 Tax=Microbacterium protaetiae TaxID=2509458 RepID=A0A4V0YDR4_9MICO|nr:serine hydrolase domain-containing protein [Microbacterium protaetiae]QAY61621.1 class A beta-lactamase-related serine hydrolase [Microbacterium protaetiae]